MQMRFERCCGWRVSFRDPQNISRSFLEYTFADEAKVLALVERTGMQLLLEDRHALDLGLRGGMGGIVLRLTSAQYSKLLRPQPDPKGSD